LGIYHTALAKKLEMDLIGVGFSVERRESIVKKVIIDLKDKLLNFKRASLFPKRNQNDSR